ncbi:MAG: hypothetical protein IJ630_03675 [Treponema sp.]|nr:hypothetical protein [Treponema sp.]
MKPTRHDVMKSEILSTAKLATEHFLTYQNYCQEIENMLTKIQSKEEINSVLYQMADGIVVAVHRTINGVDDNIPIEDYLNELDLEER